VVWNCRFEPPMPPAFDTSNRRGSAKICRPPMVAVMMTKIRVGRMPGIVIEKKRRAAPAPSIAADSWRSRGTACIAARRMSALYPVHRQLTIVAIATWLEKTSCFHWMSAMPIRFARLFARPSASLNMLEKISVTATGVTT
jgi:hypothetical protein